MTRETIKQNSNNPSFTLPIVINAVALLILLGSQAYFRNTFSAFNLDELPSTTEIAIGVIPPMFFVVLLLATLAVKYLVPKRFARIWKVVSVSGCALVIAHHGVGMWLAFSGSVLDLSLKSISNAWPLSGI